MDDPGTCERSFGCVLLNGASGIKFGFVLRQLMELLSRFVGICIIVCRQSSVYRFLEDRLLENHFISDMGLVVLLIQRLELVIMFLCINLLRL